MFFLRKVKKKNLLTQQFATFCYLFIKNVNYKHAKQTFFSTELFKPILFIHGVHKSQ